MKSQSEWIKKLSMKQHRQHQLDTPFTGKIKRDAVPAIAQISHGRWVAVCPECKNGVEYVDPDEKLFYCFSCGNHTIGGAGRPVKFPRTRVAIESRIMNRPVKKTRGANYIDRELLAEPIDEPHNWRPKELINGI